MAAGFRTRRIKCEQSIGDRLKRARIRRKISISQVEEATKIRAKFILALESDSWEQIPSEVYGRGYLETYCQFLQQPAEAIMKQYCRERETYARLCQDSQVELMPTSQLKFSRFLLTPRLLAIGVGTAALCAFVGVIAYQVRIFSSAPYLQVRPVVAQASGGSLTDLTVTVSGCTSVGAQVQVNGEVASVDPKGCFAYPAKASKGLNTFEVKAWNGKKESAEIVSSQIK